MANICFGEDECTIPGVILDILEYISGFGLPGEDVLQTMMLKQFMVAWVSVL